MLEVNINAYHYGLNTNKRHHNLNILNFPFLLSTNIAWQYWSKKMKNTANDYLINRASLYLFPVFAYTWTV